MDEVEGVGVRDSTCETEGTGEGAAEVLREILCASGVEVSIRSGVIVK